jgi:cytochrome P450 family 628
MGELAFGEGFKLMDRNEEGYYYKTTARFLPMLAVFSPTPWVFPIIKLIPILNWESNEFDDFEDKLFWKRFQSQPKESDVFEWIVSEYRQISNPTEKETIEMKSDVGLIVIAGSETTRLTLKILFYNLVCHPSAYRKLQQEVDASMKQQGKGTTPGPENTGLAKLEYLQACIDESLRFINPSPSGLQRTTLPEGLWVGERWVPGNVNVRTANNLIMRDPRAFVRPASSTRRGGPSSGRSLSSMRLSACRSRSVASRARGGSWP